MRRCTVAGSFRFLSTLSLRRATRLSMSFWPFGRLFLSTLSLRRATCPSITVLHCKTLFLSTLSLRRATGIQRLVALLRQFLSTLSLRRATGDAWYIMRKCAISIHALLAESDGIASPSRVMRDISIHALLAESDRLDLYACTMDGHFYPRSPCGERLPWHRPAWISSTFLSTLSLRRATNLPDLGGTGAEFLSTLSLRRATVRVMRDRRAKKFLSTLSLRRATMPGTPNSSACCNFYPRSPCGERRNDEAAAAVGGYFYPRSPCGERRANRRISDGENVISIHALLAESDQHPAGPAPLHRQFLSTLSLRRATLTNYQITVIFDISIHALLAESDSIKPIFRKINTRDFYPRSPCGERQYQ